MKKVTLELGGNDPAIVLPDVDAKEVAPKIFNAAMFNTGQVCVAVKRVFVHDSKYEDMVEAMKHSALMCRRSRPHCSPARKPKVKQPLQ